jgi:hypothetical protein
MSTSSSSNYRRNKAAIDQYRKELKKMLGDITEIDVKILNRAVNEGVRVAKELTPVSAGGTLVEFTTKDGEHVSFNVSSPRIGGFMRKSWRSAPAVKSKGGGATKSMVNGADYSEYVNYGHRIVQGGINKGWVQGQFMLEKAVSHSEKVLKQEFEKEIERVNREHDK